jgi:hypothetical protein
VIRTQSLTLGESVAWVHREHNFSFGHVATSCLLVCPACRRSWAELKFVDDSFVWPRSQFCEQCWHTDEWHPVPGSLFVEEGWGVIDDSLLKALPDDLLLREFNLHLKAYSWTIPPRF